MDIAPQSKNPLTLLHKYLRHSSQKEPLAGHRAETRDTKAPNLHFDNLGSPRLSSRAKPIDLYSTWSWLWRMLSFETLSTPQNNHEVCVSSLGSTLKNKQNCLNLIIRFTCTRPWQTRNASQRSLQDIPIKTMKGEMYNDCTCSLATASEVLSCTSALLKHHQMIYTMYSVLDKNNIYIISKQFKYLWWWGIGGVKVREDTFQLEFKLASQRSTFKRSVSVRIQDKKEKLLWIF